VVFFRFPNTLECAISIFKKFGLDAFIHGVNAAGLSAFNPGERRMAPLTRFLTALLLNHETYGSHLKNGKTVDIPLEIRNFYATMDVLSETWNGKMIDNYPVHCKPVEMGSKFTPEPSDPIWIAKHVKQFRYGYQIVKCLHPECCEPFQTNWNVIFPTRFMPPPTVYQYGEKGLEVVEPSIYFQNPNKFKFANLHQRLVTKKLSNEGKTGKNGNPRPVPFDSYCPSLQGHIDERVCDTCASYWPCKAAVLRHVKAHKLGFDDNKIENVDELSDEFDCSDREDETHTGEDETHSDTLPTFSIKQHLFYPFEKVPVVTKKKANKKKK
jgi:hypothetical protein